MLGYRRRILSICRSVMADRSAASSALDFGSGDGWFAAAFMRHGLAANVVPVDVLRWNSCYLEPVLYSGERLPFGDGTFDLVYSIDVLHHCSDPRSSLAELLRCSRRYVLIKDHVYHSTAGRLMLCILDEIGNRRRGVRSPYNYQRSWEWAVDLDDRGFVLERLVHPAHCHPAGLRWMLSPLQFVALWRRKAA